MSASYLNSCVKMPIDTCNNRSKLYLGKKQTAQADNGSIGKSRGKTKSTATNVAQAPTWTNNGIKTLAKFYDSIPDYCDVKHLHQAEFYSTLESLRSTSRELRTQTTPPMQDRCTSSSSHNSLANYCGIKTKTKKRSSNGKNKKKKPPSIMPPRLPPTIEPPLPVQNCDKLETHCPTIVPMPCLNEEYNKCLQDFGRLNSFKHDFAMEVADFKRALKGFEQEFKRTETQVKSTNVRPKSTSSSGTQTTTYIQAKAPTLRTAERAKCRREMLRKAFSVNDLTAGDEPVLASRNVNELAKWDTCEPPKHEIEDPTPKIQIESPTTTITTSSKRSHSAASKRARSKTKSHVFALGSPDKVPFSIFQLPTPRRALSHASPVHPVARPNLAATLRAEVSRKKVKELQNNCTYHDATPQFDWEVRKTPAWKSLSFNEPHQALLSIRLATRKAEQALQERQYELHMEMMRQRVKSAPLLLEGPTYWGPEVGKLTHRCRSEGMRHACESNQQRNKQHSGCKKKCSGRCQGAVGEGNSVKLQQLRKIYGSGSAKSCSRQSQRSSTKRSSRRETETHDSGDDLSSVDRAFL